jgi:hypothetical protein
LFKPAILRNSMCLFDTFIQNVRGNQRNCYRTDQVVLKW